MGMLIFVYVTAIFLTTSAKSQKRNYRKILHDGARNKLHCSHEICQDKEEIQNLNLPTTEIISIPARNYEITCNRN
jgi:hypothetical protein